MPADPVRCTDRPEDPRELLTESVDALERLGCQFQFCDGPTLEPIDMVTCYRCDLLARLRAAIGRPPRLPGEETSMERITRRDAEYLARCVSGGHRA